MKTQAPVEKKDILLKQDPQATEEERSAYLTLLRRFYRTGEKPRQLDGPAISSPFSVLLEEASKYPFQRPHQKTSIPFNTDVFIQLFSLLLTERKRTGSLFRENVAQLLVGLKKRIHSDPDSHLSQLKETFGFAEDMLNFDKLSKIRQLKVDDKHIAEAHKGLISQLIRDIETGLKHLNFKMIVESSLSDSLDFSAHFRPDEYQVTDHVFQEAGEILQTQITQYTRMVRACRIGQLVLDQKYQEDIHEVYFAHFSWHQFTDDEWSLFPPIIQVMDSTYAVRHFGELSEQLSKNLPTVAIALNFTLSTQSDPQRTWEDAVHAYRQELLTLATAQRNTYAFQAGTDDPEFLYDGLQKALNTTSPALCHMLAPQTDAKENEWLIRAASAGRYFPKAIYHPAGTAGLDISQNRDSRQSWPVFQIPVTGEAQEMQTIDTAFTYADYKALFAHKQAELMPVPSKFDTEDLIPLADFLELAGEEIYGKIPFIWMLDEDRVLTKAAMPFQWVISCQERWTYWQFLQKLAGIADAQEVENKEEALQKELNQLKDTFEQRVSDEKQTVIQDAIERILYGLLEGDVPITETLTHLSESGPQEKSREAAEIKEQPQETSGKEAAESPPPTVTVAYIDTEDCTSCNECVDQYPRLFRYNDDKQAVLTDPNNGTYEELVKSAEKCPAACIHPGLPKDPTDPKMAKLIDRAQKFN